MGERLAACLVESARASSPHHDWNQDSHITRSPAIWERAAWERCIRPPTRSWAAAWRSNSCLKHSRTIPNVSHDFEREARVLASLNHPNIAAIYGVEESGGRKFLVMELVPGETLAEAHQARADSGG